MVMERGSLEARKASGTKKVRKIERGKCYERGSGSIKWVVYVMVADPQFPTPRSSLASSRGKQQYFHADSCFRPIIWQNLPWWLGRLNVGHQWS